ncbi:MAG: pantoate--beta-alanine ligase [Lachnospiraceae bacterium]|nr:pantoate--beta-alanine ligase [Lachnospiraceae bacterium]
MYIEQTIANVKKQVKEWRAQGLSVGFVPTMGYLHEGHQSLIQRAVEENDKVVVSIFVNPIQFGPKEDLESYPRDLDADCTLCEKTGAAMVFCPEVSEMYGEGFSAYVDMNGVTAELCGKSRPTHFRGVCTVVCKLFNIVTPDRAYFGEKDAQQLAVIRHMVRDLNMNVEVVGCPIVREADGLAKSSRNTYLSPEERKAALVLSRSIQAGKAMIQAGEKNGDRVLEEMCRILSEEPLAKIDYVEMVRWDSIEIHHQADVPVLVAIAVYIGTTRLIDNFILE